MTTITPETCLHYTGFKGVKVFVDGEEVKLAHSINIDEGWVDYAEIDEIGLIRIEEDEVVINRAFGVVSYEGLGQYHERPSV